MARIETRMPGDGDREFAIRVERLSKRYEIYDAPRDRLKQSIFTRGRRLLGLSPKLYFREFWALRDISFDVRKGETIGIIGRNGAGKSTLLQVICGTVNPTSGTVETKGRVAALLELGAGFNPEFTGRENVFLNGSLLGLSHEETERHFDEIAAFADIGDFLDQPVKTYSSGMYVRLAFAVQSCVAPEILLVDEALAVGDIGFQYKCFKRMQALRDQGVTILMVTHSSSSVLEYASRCIVLDGGTVTHDTANVLEAVLAYEKGMLPGRARQATSPDKRQGREHYGADELRLRREQNRNASAEEQRFGSARAIIDELTISRAKDDSGEQRAVVNAGEEAVFSFRILSSAHIPGVVLGVSLSLARGSDIWGDNNLYAGETIDLEPGELRVEYRVKLPISSGEYLIHCGLACFKADQREELDQRRPMGRLRIWSSREQVGVVHAPVTVTVVGAAKS